VSGRITRPGWSKQGLAHESRGYGGNLTNLVPKLRVHRSLWLQLFDAAAWLLSYAVFAWLRFDGVSADVPWLEVMSFGAATALLYLVMAWLTQLHRGRSALASLEEMVLLGFVAMTVGGAVMTVNLLTQWIPRSVPTGATLCMLVVAAWGRAVWRRARERNDEAVRRAGGGVRALVIGGGDAGRELIGSMLRDPEQEWQPVGILDDDPDKRRRRIRGVPVVGSTVDIESRVRASQAEAVIIAIPSADAQTVARIRRAAVQAGVDVKVLPSSTQLLTDHVGIRDIRDVNLTDVLGRNQLDTDVDAIAGYLTGHRVLVTGAGGSIGSELCRQIYRFAPAELMMLDRDESALHAVQLSIHGRAMLDSDDVILCDIRDRAAIHSVFASRRPEVVFHAAALKHLPMLEQYPAEAVKTNVAGTQNVLDAAELVGVTTFVNISTDKAANPCSVLGYSKRIAEGITAQRASETGQRFVSVRFGNVLGSRGSVLTAFAKQIADGGPVTVTDEKVTRFFMTIEEACQLVIQAAAIGHPGEALVLDMGEPVRIVDVARQLMEQSGRRVPITFTGLREGEKMHEELFGDGEPHDVRPAHPLVSHVPVPPASEADVALLPTSGNRTIVRNAMASLCHELDRPLREGDGRSRRVAPDEVDAKSGL
jgi:FlaA1/EpsC-like NDP-sugar epimerase